MMSMGGETHGQADLLDDNVAGRLHGRRARSFGWGAPDDEEVHSYVNELASSFGTDLYGRRRYETMVYLGTAHTVPDQPQFVLDFARQWQAAEKIVYSSTLAEPSSARTRIEREFDPGAARRLKADAEHDITVDGPELAAQALKGWSCR